MLRVGDGQVECLWDEVLPAEARALPEDLAALDELLADPALLAAIEAHWAREAKAAGRSAAGHGRPTISMQTYVRLMVSSTAPAGDTRRWCGRCRTRFICGGFA
jgi:hypothetical protein